MRLPVAVFLLAASALWPTGALGQTAITAKGNVSGTAKMDGTPNTGGGSGIPASLGWFQIPNSTLRPLCPTYSDIQSSGGCAAIMTAWSGGVLDTVRDTLVMTGGGHQDYFGNEIYGMNLGTLATSLIKDASHGSALSNLGICPDGWTDGTRSSMHNYNGGFYAENIDRYVWFSGGVPGVCSGFTNNTWEFNPNNLTWTRKLTGDTSGSNPNTGGNGSIPLVAYDPVSGAGYMYEENVPRFWKLTVTPSYGWTVLNNSPATMCQGSSMTAAIDSSRGFYYCIGNGHFGKESLTTPYTATDLESTATGCAAMKTGAAPGFAFDTVSRKFIGWNGGNTFYIYDPDTNACTTNSSFSGGPSATPQGNGTFTRWSYSPQSGVFVIANSVDQSIYTLRVETMTSNNWANRTQGVNVPGGAASVVSSFDLNTFPTTTIQHYMASTFGNGSITNDTTTHTSDGTGSLHWHMNAGAFQGEPGTYNYNFNSGNTALYGPGSEFFVQLRVRYDSAMTNPATWSNFEGSKIVFFSEGDSPTSGQTDGCSATPTDVVIQNGTSGTFGFPINYWNCGVVGTLLFLNAQFSMLQLFGPSLPGPSGNYLDQVAAGCPHYNGFTGMPSTDPPCWRFQANEWFTLQMHVKWGGNNTADSAQNLWFAHEGQTSVLVNNGADIAIRDIGGGTTGKFGKLTLGPYPTNATWIIAANVWYCCIVVANRRIPDPDVLTPNAPDNLSLSSVSSSSITVNWRVNSNNGTPQDDVGFVVERCTNTTAQCLGNQSAWTQVGSVTFPHVSSLVDATVSTGHTYVYRVKARNRAGDSDYAKSICFNGGTTCGGTAAI